MKKFVLAIFTLGLLFNASRSLACDKQGHAETKPAGDSGAGKKAK